MHNALVALGGAFLAAGLLARLGKSFGLPTIPFFMVAGLLLGPNTPGIVLVDDASHLSLLASLGVVFLLFYLGLEFSIDELISGGAKLILSGTVFLALNFGAGLALGYFLNWGIPEALILGGAMGVSSSTIVSKLLTELGRINNDEARLILGIIVVEDIFVALYLALLQPVLGGSKGVVEIAIGFGGAILFLLLMFGVAQWGKGAVGKALEKADNELLLLTFLGVTLLIAGIGEEVGVSEAIGAFVAGLIFSGTTVAKRVQHLVLPLRDAFAAIFFFAFGLTFRPSDATAVWQVALLAAGLGIVLNIIAGAITARIHNLDRQAAANVCFTILPRGEFSLVLAALAASAGLDRRLSPLIAGYVLILALLGPLLAARSEQIARWLPQRTNAT